MLDTVTIVLSWSMWRYALKVQRRLMINSDLLGWKKNLAQDSVDSHTVCRQFFFHWPSLFRLLLRGPRPTHSAVVYNLHKQDIPNVSRVCYIMKWKFATSVAPDFLRPRQLRSCSTISFIERKCLGVRYRTPRQRLGVRYRTSSLFESLCPVPDPEITLRVLSRGSGSKWYCRILSY